MTDYTNLINASPLVMVEFYATWCPHCRNMMPAVAEIRSLLGGSADIYQIDIDKEEGVAESVNINIVPTFIIYRDGEPVWRRSGEIEGKELLQTLQQFMN